MANRELQDVELFLSIDNLVFESVFFKGDSEITLLFELVLKLHQVQMRELFILHVVNTMGTRIIEAVIDGISRGNNL